MTAFFRDGGDLGRAGHPPLLLGSRDQADSPKQLLMHASLER